MPSRQPNPTIESRWLGRPAILIVVGAMFLGGTAVSMWPRAGVRPQLGAAAPARFVGSQACAGCHAAQQAQWRLSAHHRAMEPADERSVLGDFNDAVFRYFGRATRFSRDGRSFRVTTENQQGRPETFTVAYTLGYKPLQQYLVALDGGRIQALPFAWDTRPRQEGGQRWFHLYPDRDVRPGDPLFWTRPQQNWNHMCGDCHTTNFAKNFSDTEGRFDSRWSEIGNGCESCHGAGSAHVEAGRGAAASAAASSINALREPAAQFDQCGACHARRVRLHESPSHEQMHQSWRPELLLDGLYFVDGQIRDEVFETGSFLQSKKAARGGTCTSCHDPHTTTLKAAGNALCTQCHGADAYDTERHHFHPAGTRGTRCVGCHMPARTYMVVDPRRDHRFAVPRPDLSDALGTPNACAACHQGRTPAWAAEAVRRHVTAREGGPRPPDTFGTALWQARNEQVTAVASVRALIDDQSVSAIARATAIAALGNAATPESLAVIRPQLGAADPMIRLGAVQALSGVPLPQRAPLLIHRLRDDSRAVRLALAPLLAGSDRAALTIEQRRDLDAVFAEYRQWLTANADRAEALVALAGFHLAEGDLAAARAAFEKALQRDETSLVAHLNYADYHRSMSNDHEAERLIRKASALYPDSANARFALGLLLVRQKRLTLALPELRRATELAPANSYFAYVYAVGLYSAGQARQALSLLGQARARFPANRQIPAALQAYCADQRGKRDVRADVLAGACR